MIFPYWQEPQRSQSGPALTLTASPVAPPTKKMLALTGSSVGRSNKKNEGKTKKPKETKTSPQNIGKTIEKNQKNQKNQGSRDNHRHGTAGSEAHACGLARDPWFFGFFGFSREFLLCFVEHAFGCFGFLVFVMV